MIYVLAVFQLQHIFLYESMHTCTTPDASVYPVICVILVKQAKLINPIENTLQS